MSRTEQPHFSGCLNPLKTVTKIIYFAFNKHCLQSYLELAYYLIHLDTIISRGCWPDNRRQKQPANQLTITVQCVLIPAKYWF